MELSGGLVLWNSVLFVIKFTIEGSYVRCNGLVLVLVCWRIEMLVDHVAYFERKAEEWESHGKHRCKPKKNDGFDGERCLLFVQWTVFRALFQFPKWLSVCFSVCRQM